MTDTLYELLWCFIGLVLLILYGASLAALAYLLWPLIVILAVTVGGYALIRRSTS